MSDTKLVYGNKNKEFLSFLHTLVNSLISGDEEKVSQIFLSHFNDDSLLPCVVVDFKDMNIKISPLNYLDWLAQAQDENIITTLSEFNLISLKLNNVSQTKLVSAVVLAFMNLGALGKLKEAQYFLNDLDEDWKDSNAMFMSFFNHTTKQFFVLNP